jgi:hypothetical protein
MIGCIKLIRSLGIWLALNAAVPAQAEGIFGKRLRPAGKTIEKSLRDVGKAIEGNILTPIPGEKRREDAWTAQSPSNPCIANPTLPQCMQ